MITTASLGEPVFETIMNVVIIYDDSASAAKTNAMLDKASHQAGEVAPSDVKPWRVDLLNLPPTAAEALREAADAHLIVFALRPAQSLPVGLLDWLEHWARQRQVGEAALAIFSDASGNAPSAPVVSELLRFTGRHGLNFIFDDSGSGQDEVADYVRGLREREICMTSTLRQTLEQIMSEPAQERWGINE